MLLMLDDKYYLHVHYVVNTPSSKPGKTIHI